MCDKCILLFDRRNVEKKIKDANSRDGDKAENSIQIEINDKILTQANNNSPHIASKVNQFYKNYNCSHIKSFSGNYSKKRSRNDQHSGHIQIYPHQSSIGWNVRSDKIDPKDKSQRMVTSGYKQLSKTNHDIKHSIDNILKKDNEKDKEMKRQLSHEVVLENEDFAPMESGITNGLYNCTNGTPERTLPIVTKTKTDCRYIYRCTDISLHLQKKEDSQQLMIHRTDSQVKRTYNVHQLESSWPKLDADHKYDQINEQFGCGQRSNPFNG